MKTDIYDDEGCMISEYDTVEGWCHGEYIQGTVLDDGRTWYVSNVNGGWSPDLWTFESVRIKERYR